MHLLFCRALPLLSGLLLLLCSRGFTQPLDLRGYIDAHDPSTIIKCKNRYYTFHTGQGISSSWSSNKVFWSPGPAVFATPPAWTTLAVPGFTGTFWAPDILFFNNKYHLYYSVSTWGSQVSAIGLATNATLDPSDPNYLWTDHGIVIQSSQGSPYNTIDPGVTWDAQGNLWLVYGSYWSGIYLVQLDTQTGLRISPDSPTHRLAWNGSIEAAWIYRKNDYYYLFVNWGSCCSGVNSSYNVRVGRSTQITGPYLDANGVDMVDGGGTLFLRATGKHTGPGHIGVLAENGTELFSFHYYDANSWAPHYDGYGTAKLGLAPLLWTADGWPRQTNEWSAVYDFNYDARDANGQSYGLLKNGAAVVRDPIRGGALALDGTDQYAWLPPSVANAQTVSAVVKWQGGGPWQRIFDFGFDTGKTFMLTPRAGTGVLRCDLNTGGNLDILQWDRALPTNVWTHVGVTVDGSRGVLYVNGAPVATNDTMVQLPAQGAFQTNHLGRSKFAADEYFKGQYARLTVHGRALSAAEIVAPLPDITEPVEGLTYGPGSLVQFSGSATDFMALPIASPGLSWTISHIDGTSTNVVLGPVSGLTSGLLSIPSSGPMASNGFHQITLAATDSSGRQGSQSRLIFPGTNWASYYPFTSSAQDASNNFHGSLFFGATIQNDATRGKVLGLSGVGQFLRLPVGAASAQTISMWAKWNGGPAWQRLFDFGRSTSCWYHFAVKDNANLPEVAITADADRYVHTVPVSESFPVGQWTHVAVVLDGRQAVLYINGEAVGVNNSVNLLPSDVAGQNSWIGRSQFTADAYYSGYIDALKLNSTAIPPERMFAPHAEIIQPMAGAQFSGGVELTIVGAAYDYSEAPLPGTNISWTVAYESADASQTVLGPTNASAVNYTIPTLGPLSTNVAYRVSMAATDSNGLRGSANATVTPRVARLTLETVPPGLSVSVDGQAGASPVEYDLVPGYERTISAPSPQNLLGSNYTFVLWSDGGAATHQVQIPSTNSMLTASFVKPHISLTQSTGSLQLSWPAWARTARLYATTDLVPALWTEVTNAVVVGPEYITTTLPMDNAQTFYRLQP